MVGIDSGLARSVATRLAALVAVVGLVLLPIVTFRWEEPIGTIESPVTGRDVLENRWDEPPLTEDGVAVWAVTVGMNMARAHPDVVGAERPSRSPEESRSAWDERLWTSPQMRQGVLFTEREEGLRVLYGALVLLAGLALLLPRRPMLLAVLGGLGMLGLPLFLWRFTAVFRGVFSDGDVVIAWGAGTCLALAAFGGMGLLALSGFPRSARPA